MIEAGGAGTDSRNGDYGGRGADDWEGRFHSDSEWDAALGEEDRGRGDCLYRGEVCGSEVGGRSAIYGRDSGRRSRTPLEPAAAKAPKSNAFADAALKGRSSTADLLRSLSYDRSSTMLSRDCFSTTGPRTHTGMGSPVDFTCGAGGRKVPRPSACSGRVGMTSEKSI